MARPEYTNWNQIIGNFLEKTLWIWLPFHAIIRLTRDMIDKHDKEKEKP
ncbi:MAG: hypothetical protein ABFQ53_01575 [Patescibacteria group bacterium]